jgi:hypothetical protein
MGAGNPIIRCREGNAYPTFYIDYNHSEDCEIDCLCSANILEDLTEYTEPLINRFRSDKKGIYIAENIGNPYEAQHRILKTKVFEVFIKYGEQELVLGCVPVYKENGDYNKQFFELGAERFMSFVAKRYKIRIRCSAWTSAEITNNFYKKDEN